MTKIRYGALAAAVAGALALGSPAVAQDDAREYLSHHTCFKIKPDQKVKGSVTIDALLAGTAELGFNEQCKLKKATHLCVQSHKQSVNAELNKQAITEQPGRPGTEAVQLCYKVSCKEKPDVQIAMHDQLAGYVLEKPKADILCGPAVNTCSDPTRTVFAGGPRTGDEGGSCRQFTTQATCEEAWAAHEPGGSLVPMACAWSGSDCRGSDDVNGTNPCVSCANAALTLVSSCNTGTPDQATCEGRYIDDGGFGATSCAWNGSSCQPCGLTNELQLPDANPGVAGCSNTCREVL